MKTSTIVLAGLLSSSAAAPMIAQPAFAQSTAASGQALDEIVVTATRQTSTVNKVPLSITAETQADLDKQGIRNASDLQKAVPSLNISNPVGGVAQYAIRGIFSTQGAATTGVYIDDTNLTKRNNLGSGNLGVNGAPTPPLFDLARVEVLRGPQGTLYGGSSEGGTVRFITTQPSLTTISGNARATVSALTYNGSTSFDAGVALGGPIVQDKLGFRVSLFEQYTGGYIDQVDPYHNFATIGRNINWTNASSIRAAMLWAPTTNATVSLAWYHSFVHDNSDANIIYRPNGNSYTTPASCYNTARQFGGSPAPTAAVACPTNAVPGQTVNGIFERGAQTYGPLNVNGYETIDPINQEQSTTLDVIPLTLGYDFGWMTAKSITSYIHDYGVYNGTGNAAEYSNAQTTTALPGVVGFPLFAPALGIVGYSLAKNVRSSLTEELRFSSPAEAKKFTWVAGLYFSSSKTIGSFCQSDPALIPPEALYGISDLQRYGAAEARCRAEREQNLKESEIAGFGEANYNLTDRLKVIVGLRVSQTQFNFYQTFLGPLVGWDVPTVANSGLTTGSQKNTPITPKFGLEYQFTPNDLVYASAAEGYRAGGVNNPFSASICAPGLAALGLTVSDIPKSYNPDSVWSYEAGTKLRALNGRVQVNADVYQIDWKNVQLSVAGIAAGCVQTYVGNAGNAQSRGAEFETQARLFAGLKGSLAIGYTSAQYTQGAFGPTPISGAAPVIIVRKGDQFPIPQWTLNLGLQYDFTVASYTPYVRADYSYLGAYVRGPGPGVSSYAPDTRNASAVRRLDMRMGVPVKTWEVNVFATNLLNSQDTVANGGGRTGCAIATGAACSTFTNYNPYTSVGVTRPREVGMQAMYRF